MKLSVVVLIGSAALNAALFALLASRPSLAPVALRKYLPEAVPSKEAAKTPPPSAPAKNKGTGVEVLWPKLKSDDLAALVRQLREAGFPAVMVRAIVDGELERRFGPRIRELTRSLTEIPYWKPDTGYYMGNSKLYESISQIYRERSALLREVLGKDMFAYSGMDPSVAQQRIFGNLPQAKIDLVQRINDDYAEMSSQVRSAMQGVALPEDREKLALLEREKQKDLAEILTPQELADYEMRSSQITSRLRTSLTIMDASEAEFQSIYRIHGAFKDVLYPPPQSAMVYITADLSEKRREAQQQIHDQVKAALGDARYQQYQRATDNDFQQLYRLGQRDNVPYETLVKAHEVRNSTAEASIKIIENSALSPTERQTALKTLAQEARNKLLSTLGPGAGPTYVENSRWLGYIDQGRGVAIGPDGNLSSRSGPMPRPPATATPKG
jgi:hypothetical protein